MSDSNAPVKKGHGESRFDDLDRPIGSDAAPRKRLAPKSSTSSRQPNPSSLAGLPSLAIKTTTQEPKSSATATKKTTARSSHSTPTPSSVDPSPSTVQTTKKRLFRESPDPVTVPKVSTQAGPKVVPVSVPVSRSTPASSALSDGLWPIRGILEEDATRYRVAWEDVNGQEFEPTWEPKGKVRKHVVREWEVKKRGV